MTGPTPDLAITRAATIVLEKLHADIIAGLDGLSPAALNWRPLPEANSIAGLLSHMVEAATYLLAVGRGVSIQRDRDAQFGRTASNGEEFLLGVSAAWPRLVDAALTFSASDLGAARDFRGRPVNGAWCLLHACDHMLEHWGQIQLTRDLYRASTDA